MCCAALAVHLLPGVIAPMQSAIATPYLGTPILNFFMRLLGVSVGKHVIFLGTIPTETPLFTLGDNVVVSTAAAASAIAPDIAPDSRPASSHIASYTA